MKEAGLPQVIERRMIKHMCNYEQQAAFEQCIRFLAEMIEKYAGQIEFPAGSVPNDKEQSQ